MRPGRPWKMAAGLIALIGTAGCETEPELVDDVFTPAEWDKVKTLSPLPSPPPSPSNRFADDPAAAALGQALFFDRGYSGPILTDGNPWGAKGEAQKVNCESCHAVDHGFANEAETSTGTGLILGRNTLGLLNTAYYDWSGWQGFIDTMWGHAILAGPECANCMNSSRLAIARHMSVHYRDQYEAIFPDPLDPDLDPAAPNRPDGTRRFPLLSPSEYPLGKPAAPNGGVWVQMSEEDQQIVDRVVANYGKALEAYTRKLVSKDGPFDRYVAGEAGAISASAKRGLKLFVGKAACVECHSGPNFSDDKFHNDGVPAPDRARLPDGTFNDQGRLDGLIRVTTTNKIWSSDGPHSDQKSGNIDSIPTTPYPEGEAGKYRTKGLRSVAQTAPYMHSGSFKTLRDVVVFYNQGGAESGFVGTKSGLLKPLNLSEQEIDDLVAFLQSLDGAPLPADLLQPPSP